jgi:hypothetical protein
MRTSRTVGGHPQNRQWLAAHWQWQSNGGACIMKMRLKTDRMIQRLLLDHCADPLHEGINGEGFGH